MRTRPLRYAVSAPRPARAHARGGHEEEHEEHENHERWLVSYADMMTLLMVLFIVMFALSEVNQKKFDVFKAGLHAGFAVPIRLQTSRNAGPWPWKDFSVSPVSSVPRRWKAASGRRPGWRCSA